MYKNIIYEEFCEAKNTLNYFFKNKNNITKIQSAAILLANAFKRGKKVLSCGNGGSQCDSMHFSEELTGCYREKRPPYPAISISDVAHISCVSNDFSYEYVFSRYIEAIGVQGDVLLTFSTSGNSVNILNAAKIAHTKGMKVIALTGKDGGKIAKIADIEIRVSYFGYSDRIQEVHMKINHILILLIEKEMLRSDRIHENN